MRTSLFAVLLTGMLWIGLEAQVIKHVQPQQSKPLKLPPIEEVAKEIAEARTVRGVQPPTGGMLEKAAGTLDGEKITLNEVMDEVLVKYGPPFVQFLASQAMLQMEVLKRDVQVSDEDLLEEVRYYKAQSPSKASIKEQLEKSRKGWDWLKDTLTTRAAIGKIMKADQNITTPGPPNQFLMQIWAGGVAKKYQIEMKKEKLPSGCLARIQTTWGLGKVLSKVKSARAAGKPYTLGREKKDSGEVLIFTPPEGGWPRFYIPNVKVKVTRNSGEASGQSEISAEEILNQVVGGTGGVSAQVMIYGEDGKTPVLSLPHIDVSRRKVANMPPEKVALLEAVQAILNDQAVVDTENFQVKPREGKGPIYDIPRNVYNSVQAPFRARVIDVLAGLVGAKRTVAPVLVLARNDEADFVMLPPVPVEMKTLVDRAAALSFFFGTLKLAQFEDSLANLARFKAVKKAFSGHPPGKPTADKPSAPWGVITVDEKAVADRIARERNKYEGTRSMFSWEMICGILNKTVPEEMRRFWVGNGVDQIIGTKVDEATLKKYYEDHVDNFGVATVEANHILIQMKDGRTGRIQWEKARKKAEEILAMIRTGASFDAMAEKFSEDPTTKDKGGDLGLFTLVSRYDLDLCKAIFAMEPGQISPAPIRTKLGYHIARLRKKDPPNPEKYGFDSPGRKEDVQDSRQQALRDEWLRENVYSKFKLENFLENLFL